MKKELVAKYIDHTLLAPTAGIKEIMRLCDEAKRYSFASVCVNPYFVNACKCELETSSVNVCTVIGFPLGASSSNVKCYEASVAVRDGADEIDMVINIGSALEGRFSEIEAEIACVVNASRREAECLSRRVVVKVILETCFLDDSTIETLCQCAKAAGADFVKTSTGFATPRAADGSHIPNGASTHHIELMRRVVGPDFGVKASGGIRNANMALSMIQAGANRIGTSSGVTIIDTWDETIKVQGID